MQISTTFQIVICKQDSTHVVSKYLKHA